MFCDILIPTYQNLDMLITLLRQILVNNILIRKIYVINNGCLPLSQYIQNEKVEVLNPGKNLGWEGGLKLGLQHSDAPNVVFMNDDLFIPISSHFWLSNLLRAFDDPEVAAAGPTSNVVAGVQSIFHPASPAALSEVAYLIGFCVLVRRAALDFIGGVDDTLPGGDDFDLSIRFRRAGFKLVVDPNVFIWHHGFVTGTKLYGGPEKPGGWNSQEMSDRTNQALIRKHGFKSFISTMMGFVKERRTDYPSEDVEGNVIRNLGLTGSILELGCGGVKTVGGAIGLDRIPKGQLIPGISQYNHSVADIVGDASDALPFDASSFDHVIARHILEHMIDPVKVLKEWDRVLKPGGSIVLALPDHEKANTITMNPEHCHAYTKDSIVSILSICGFKHERIYDSGNKISFVVVANKALVAEEACCAQSF